MRLLLLVVAFDEFCVREVPKFAGVSELLRAGVLLFTLALLLLREGVVVVVFEAGVRLALLLLFGVVAERV